MNETSEYPCPTWLMHVFKHRVLKMYERGELVDDIYFKDKDGKFSVGGVMCDIWAQVTGKAAWVGADQLRYETFTGSISHASQSVPFVIINNFVSKTSTNCAVSNFIKITNFKLSAIIPFLKHVKDFDDVNFPAEKTFEYLVSYSAGLLPDLFKTTIEAPSFSEAREIFARQFHHCKIITVNYVKTLT